MTQTELGGTPSVDERRLYDFRRFRPLTQTTPIWYLGQYHEPERVFRQWFTANRRELLDRDVNAKQLTYSLSHPFDAVWAAIRNESQFAFLRESPRRNEGEQSLQTCPRCGQEGIGNLPRHLRSCNE